MVPSRLSTYRLIAAAPLAAMASGATADIVYTELDYQIGGPGDAPMIGGIQIGTIGSLGFTAGSNSNGPERLFFANAKNSPNMGLMNTFAAPLGGDSSWSGGKLARFQAGDLIQLDLGIQLAGKGIGSAGWSKSGGKGIGNFVVMNGEAESGYLGFTFENMGVNGVPSLNYGWVSVSWDGTYLSIDGYAYETDADTGIVAGAIPAPGAIGLLGLAAGAAGIRRKRQA
jgi:hypothetical protein